MDKQFFSQWQRKGEASILNAGNYADGGKKEDEISLTMQAHIIRERIRETIAV